VSLSHNPFFLVSHYTISDGTFTDYSTTHRQKYSFSTNNFSQCRHQWSDEMNELIRFLRRMVIRWQLRSLESQAKSIVEARNHALMRLMEIRRERECKEIELGLFPALPR